jgi:uncharacterized FlgJ-related protein
MKKLLLLMMNLLNIKQIFCITQSMKIFLKVLMLKLLQIQIKIEIEKEFIILRMEYLI